MLKLLTILLMILSLNVFAQTKEELASTLEMMKSNGLINEQQYQQSLKDLKAMSDEDFNKIKEQAQTAKNDPKIKAQIEKLKKAHQSKQNP